jgi:hypothetical protein
MAPNDTPSTYTASDWLRITCILTFIPALALNIPHATLYHTPLPALGLIPAGISVILALYELGLLKLNYSGLGREYQVLLEDEPAKHSTIRKSIVAILDLLIAGGFILCIGGGFIVMLDNGYGEWQRRGTTQYDPVYWRNNCTKIPFQYMYSDAPYNAVEGGILGAFATVPFFVNT